MSFNTVAGPNLGQRPTFDPGSSLLWELSALKVAQGGRHPTAVLNAAGPRRRVNERFVMGADQPAWGAAGRGVCQCSSGASTWLASDGPHVPAS